VKIDVDVHTKLKAIMTALRQDRLPWWQHWRELADYYMPKRYVWLLSVNERTRYVGKNPYIIDGTGTSAARTLASGMMNGITSPSRPWFKLRVSGFADDLNDDERAWCDEVERRMLLVMSESNFYNALAIMYLDLAVFGTAAMLIYDDIDSVIRCYNCALGEYYLGQSARQIVNTFARTFTMKVGQVCERWGVENLSDRTRIAYNARGARLYEDIEITHLIEPNLPGAGALPDRFRTREWYWESSADIGTILGQEGYFEPPGIFPRWELTGNDSYGTGPSMDALGDVIQLQQESKRKAQSLDYMLRPPMLLDVQLQHRPTAYLPGGTTFVQGLNQGAVGAKPFYQIQPPIQELTMDLRDIQTRIRETFHNDLFRMISQLETVRSATEIDARREEKLVLLGPVLERFQNEGLDPAISRTYGSMLRAGLIPPPPNRIAGAHLEVQYVSVLSTAQNAVGAAPTERWIQLIGNIVGVVPEAKLVPDWIDLIRSYGRDVGVKAKSIRPVADIERDIQTQQAAAVAQAATPAVNDLTGAAKNLSATDVGGGANALQQILGG
jgi:hypothetical protein